LESALVDLFFLSLNVVNDFFEGPVISKYIWLVGWLVGWMDGWLVG